MASPNRNNHGVTQPDPTATATISGTNTDAFKLYEAFIFSGPIVFILIVLYLFYFFYLRRHSVDWSSLRMRPSTAAVASHNVGVIEVGLKKEIRELLPVVVFKESFSIKDTQLELLKVEQLKSNPKVVLEATGSWICGVQTASFECSVCLGDYEAEDKLQQIPGCGHTFHLNCIDHWLTTHTTCPLCRLSLINSPKAPPASEPDNHNHTGSRFENSENGDNVLQHHSLPV